MDSRRVTFLLFCVLISAFMICQTEAVFGPRHPGSLRMKKDRELFQKVRCCQLGLLPCSCRPIMMFRPTTFIWLLLKPFLRIFSYLSAFILSSEHCPWHLCGYEGSLWTRKWRPKRTLSISSLSSKDYFKMKCNLVRYPCQSDKWQIINRLKYH